MADSEQQPLLGSDDRAEGVDRDLEGGGHEHSDSKSWREWTAKTLESQRLHKTVIALITIDASCVLADLTYTFLTDTCEVSEGNEPLWLTIAAHISLIITTFFLIEIPLTIWAFGFSYYRPRGPVLHASLHLFDAFVIVTTFVLEFVLRGRERELAGLLIILRLWRLVKLVGGVAVGAGELNEETSKRLAEAEEQLSRRAAVIAKLQADNNDLRSRLASFNGDTTTS